MKMQRAINYLLDLVVVSVCAIVLTIGGYATFDAVTVSTSADIDTGLVELADSDDSKELFRRLSEESSSVVGWLKIYDTNINYPLVQGKDNDYFLSRNYKGEYATAGSAFLDYRNSYNFSDNITIIYGHRMGYGKMFSDVTRFSDKKYFETHEGGKLLTKTGSFDLDIVLFAKIKADEVLVYGIDAAQDGRALELLEAVASHNRGVNYGDKHILLSTCDANDKSMRDVLLVRVLRGGMVQ